jgi:hypothetical protein
VHNSGAIGVKKHHLDFNPDSGRFRHKCGAHWRSYSPFSTRFQTLKPAFLASDTESGLTILGVENPLMSFCTGLRQSGHFSRGGAEIERFNEKLPLQIRQSPEQGSYS